MSDETYMLESHNDASNRFAVFEDDGTSAWLYLTGANDRKPVASVWIHNRITAPPSSQIKNYRGGPPPAASGFTDDISICHDPDAHDWTFAWRDDGDAVVINCNGIPVAMLVASDRRGWSRNLKRDGPWGNVWDEKLYSTVVENGG